jgi:hypothetical protein
MPELDPRLILANGQDTMGLNSVGQVYDDASKIQLHRETMQKAQQANADQVATREAYRRATKADGSIDQGILLSSLAQLNAGSVIPSIQKANLETRKTQGEIDYKDAETKAKVTDTLYNGLKQADNSIASLLAKSDVNELDVYGEVGRLVKIGAFDAQAQHVGKSPDDFARDMLSTLPVGNPEALRNWLTQAGARTMDATKRIEMSVPKYDEQNRGGTINQGTVNQWIGQRTEGAGPANNIVPTADPNAVLKSKTDYGIAGIVDNRARETNDINREASQTQIVDGPNGPNLVNKSTGLARPVATTDGSPLLNKDSVIAKNARLADTLTGQIGQARTLLKKATGSGAGKMIDTAGNFVGLSTDGADAAAQLETLSGWMTSNVPRFEGPQSDKDTGTYQIMAARVGDRSVPVSQRSAALDIVEQLMAKYSGKPGTAPAGMVVPAPPPAGSGPMLARPQRGGSYQGRTPIGSRPGQQPPSIDSFFKS